MDMGCRGPFDPPSLCDRAQQQEQEEHRERSPRRRESKSRQRDERGARRDKAVSEGPDHF
jgi:hypothetical protein